MNPNVPHNSQPPVCILSQINPLHALTSHFLNIHLYIRLGLPSCLFPSGFPTKTLYTPLLSPILATCSARLVLLDLTARIKFGEEYRSLRSSLCSFPHSHVTSLLLDPNILLDALFPNILSLLTVPIRSKIFRHKPRAFPRLILLIERAWTRRKRFAWRLSG